jgi:hypothetical protein
MAGTYTANGPSKTNQEAIRLETYGARPVGRLRQRWQEDVMENLKKLKVKNWKKTAKDRKTWRDLAEKAKTHEGLLCQMMMMMMMFFVPINKI